MKAKTKRLSLFLAFIMILSMFSGLFVVNAESTKTYLSLTAADKAAIAEGKVWKVNDSYYKTWSEVVTQLNSATKATTVYVLADTTLAYLNMSSNVKVAVTIEGVTQADGEKPVLTTSLQRAFCYEGAGSLTINNIKIVADTVYQAVLESTKPLELNDVDIVSSAKITHADRGVIYLNSATANLTMNRSTVKFAGTTQGKGIITPKYSGTTITINDSSLEASNASTDPVKGVIWANNFATTININNSILSIKNATASDGFGIINLGGSTYPTQSVTITNSILNASESFGYRIVYASGNHKNVTVTVEDSAWLGAPQTWDLMQANASSKAILKGELVFVGGCDKTSGTANTMFRSVSIVDGNGTDISSTYRTHKDSTRITTSSANAMATVFASFPKDDVAKMFGYSFRNTDNAETAFANGAFTGYYKSVPTDVGGTFYQFADYHHTSGTSGFTKSTEIIGIGDPTYYADTRFVLVGSTNDGDKTPRVNNISFTMKDLNVVVAPNKALGTIFRIYGEGSSLKLNNVDLTYNCQYGLIEMKNFAGISVNINDCNITGVTGDQTSLYLVRSSGDANANNVVTVSNSTVDLSAVTTGQLFTNKKGAKLTMENSVAISKTANVAADILKGTNVINGYTVTTGNANGVAYNTKLLGNAMLEGAAVRITNKGLNDSGLRFMSTVSADAITAAGTGAKFGTVIFRYADYSAWMADNAGKTMADFIAAAKANDADTLKVVDIEANTGKIENDDGSCTIYAALVNIKESNYETDFGAVSYIKTADGTVVYSAFDSEDNVRNITEVATKALDDTKAESSDELVDGYKYNIAIKAGEVYYVDGVKTTAGSDSEAYSPYTSTQRELLNQYLGNQ